MTKPKAPGQYQLIPVNQIDEPPNPIRAEMDPDELGELALSIERLGVIEPLVVFARDSRYEIQAGHRRLLAARLAKLEAVPCIVRDPAEISGEGVKVHENVYREELNAAEEAAYFDRLLQSDCGGDTDRLSELVRQRRDYVERRLNLLRGYPDVTDALRARKISLAVAEELNKFTDEGYMKVSLESAVKSGASARVVRDQRVQCNAVIERQQATGSVDPAPTSAEPLPPHETSIICFLCHDPRYPYDMEVLHVHRSCHNIILNRLIATAGRDAESQIAPPPPEGK